MRLLGVIFVGFFLNFALLGAESTLSNTESKQDFQVFALVNYDKNLLENGSFDGYVMSEKLDGVRALWNGKKLLSRSGRAFSVPKCYVEALPDFELDGELFIGRGKFEEVLSIVSKQQHKCEKCACEEWQKVGYFIFDVPKACENEATPCTLLERLSVLEQWLAQRQNNADSNTLNSSVQSSTPLRIIPQEPISNQRSLESKLKDITKNGGEGLVIRKNNAPYETFRTRNAMKLKGYEDTECTVVAHHLGKGKYANVLGSLTCEGAKHLSCHTEAFAKSRSIQTDKCVFANHLYTSVASQPQYDKVSQNHKILFKIGSGFSDKDRENPPPIGSTITYKYYGLTKNGLPRFPVFLRIYSPQ